MLGEMLAGQFIEKVRKYTDYNINIMNEKGIIVASKTESRVGTFHEIAFRILHGEEDEITVTENEKFPGVMPGVNMAVFHEGKKVGVVGITGTPDKVRPIALVIRMSLETVLDYELYKEEHFQRKSLKEQFLTLTIYGSRTPEDGRELEECARQLGTDEKFVRFPVIFTFSKPENGAEKMLRGLRDYHFIAGQDVAGVTRDNNILIYRYLENSPQDIARNHKEIIRENLEQCLWYLENYAEECRICVGSCQSRFSEYHMAYQHCRWLVDYSAEKHSEIFFFYDYVWEYLQSLLPLPELSGIFGFFQKNLDDKILEIYRELIPALSATNYNLEETGKKLHVHKNTVAYRLNKVKDTMNLNPIISQKDRELACAFSEYLKRQGKAAP